MNPNDLRIENAAALPVQMCVETTRWCNLKCIHCRRTVFGLNGSDPMSPELLEQLGKALPKMDYFAISGWGESLQSQSTWELLRLARESGMTGSVTTNGSLLNEKNRELLIESQASFLAISWDAGTAEGYRRLRPGGVELDEVSRNVGDFIEMRNRMGLKHPQVGGNFVLHEDSVRELVPLVRLLAKIGVPHLCIQPVFDEDYPAQPRDYRLTAKGVEAYDAGVSLARETGMHLEHLLPQITEIEVGRSSGLGRKFFFQPSREEIREHRLVAACKTAWESPFLAKDGKLYPCNSYPEPLGDVTADGYEGAFNSPAFQKFRKGLQCGEPSEYCRRCRYSVWFTTPEPRELESALRMDEAEMVGLGFYALERPEGAPPFRWARGVCDFYLRNNGDRWLFIEGRALEQDSPIEVELNGRSVGKVHAAIDWRVMTLELPEFAEPVLHVTLRCPRARRDPATPLPWERRRLLGLAITQAGLCARPAEVTALMPGHGLLARARGWIRRQALESSGLAARKA